MATQDFSSQIQDFVTKTNKEKMRTTYDDWEHEQVLKGTLAAEDCEALNQAAITIESKVQDNRLTPEQGQESIAALERYRDALQDINKNSFDKETNEWKPQNNSETRAIYNDLKNLQNQTSEQYDPEIREQNKAYAANKKTGDAPDSNQTASNTDSLPPASRNRDQPDNDTQQTNSPPEDSKSTAFEELVDFFLKLIGLPPINSPQGASEQHNAGMPNRDPGGEPSVDQIRNAINAPENQVAVVKGFANSPLAQKLAGFALSTDVGRDQIKKGLDYLGPEVKNTITGMLNDPKLAQFTQANQENFKQLGLSVSDANIKQQSAAPRPTMSPAPDTQKPLQALTEKASQLQQVSNTKKILENQETIAPTIPGLSK